MRALIFYTLCLIFASSNAYARESKKEKKYRASEFRKALISLHESYVQFQLEGNCGPKCSAQVTGMTKNWTVITKKLSKKRLETLDATVAIYKKSLKDNKLVDSSYRSLKEMFLKYFKFRLEPLQRPSYADGERLYDKFCLSCHGAGADGRGFLALNPKFPMIPAPSNLRMLSELGISSPLYIALSSLEGVDGTGMKPLRDELNHHELWSLSYYVQSLSGNCNDLSSKYVTDLSLKYASFYSDQELVQLGFEFDPKFRCSESSWDLLKR